MVGRSRLDTGDQRRPVLGQSARAIPRLGHGAQQNDGSRRGVQADAVADAPVPVGVVGEHQGDAPLMRRGVAQAGPTRRQRRGEIDAVGDRLIGHHVALGGGVVAGGGLERHGAGENPAVDLGQGHVHGDIARPQPARLVAPGGLAAAGEDHLEHRAIGLVERRPHRLAARRGDGETGRIQHHRGRRLGQQFGDQGGRDRVLEAGHMDRQGIETLFGEGLDQGVDGRRVGRLHEGAVEDDGGDGGAALPQLAQIIEAGGGHCGPVDPGANQGRGLAPGPLKADQAGRIAQEIDRVVDAAMDAVLPQAMGLAAGHQRELVELGVGLIVARQQGQRDAAGPRRGDQPLHPVSPIARPAEQPHHHQAGMTDDVVHIAVDRQGMAEMHEIGEAQAGRAVAGSALRRGEAGEFRIRRG